jgi:BolA protein
MSIQQRIEEKLKQTFNLQHLEVENESHQHSVPANSETHFKVTMVSPDFEGKTLVARHQSAYKVLNEELQAGLHALALHMFTEPEWLKRKGISPQSPACMGGSKQDAKSQ